MKDRLTQQQHLLINVAQISDFAEGFFSHYATIVLVYIISFFFFFL